jgi:hypothetical protein
MTHTFEVVMQVRESLACILLHLQVACCGAAKCMRNALSFTRMSSSPWPQRTRNVEIVRAAATKHHIKLIVQTT